MTIRKSYDLLFTESSLLSYSLCKVELVLNYCTNSLISTFHLDLPQAASILKCGGLYAKRQVIKDIVSVKMMFNISFSWNEPGH